jgi:hypothetical protein
MPTGLEALTTWPLGCILMHLAVLGIVYCFARFPIFGRPKELPPESVSDFAKHIEAMGEMLERTGDPGFASSRLVQYQQLVTGEVPARAGEFPPSPPSKPATGDPVIEQQSSTT